MSACPTPWKTDYPNPQRAFSATRKAPDQEPYHCSCGVWHLATVQRKRKHNMAASGKSTYRDKWRQRKIRQKLFRRTGKNRVQGT